MKHNKLIIIICTILLVSSAALLIVLLKSKQQNQPKELPINIKEISLGDVRLHNNKSDCWTIIEQSVYDITPYINSHPGGDVIIKACGTVGTDLFNNRQDSNGNPKGTHSVAAKDNLSTYRIGILAP